MGGLGRGSVFGEIFWKIKLETKLFNLVHIYGKFFIKGRVHEDILIS